MVWAFLCGKEPKDNPIEEGNLIFCRKKVCKQDKDFRVLGAGYLFLKKIDERRVITK